MNKVILMGNLTQDFELRNTQSGKQVASGGLATNESFTDSSGNKQQKAEFHNLVVWGKQAETLAQYTKKGSKLLVEGRLTYSDYTNTEGVKKFKTEIIVSSFHFLDKREDNKETVGGVSSEITVDQIPFN